MACVLDYVELSISFHSGQGEKIVSDPCKLQCIGKSVADNLTIRETLRTNYLPQEEEASIITLVVKAIRENHPKDGKHHVEATQIINKPIKFIMRSILSSPDSSISSWRKMSCIALL